MKKINTKYFQYDWLFEKYPGIIQAYQWYLNNSYKYQFLKNIKLFKKYIFNNDVRGMYNLYIVGASLDQLNNFINLYALTKTKYSCIQTEIFQIDIKNFKDSQLFNNLYNDKNNEFLKIQDIL